MKLIIPRAASLTTLGTRHARQNSNEDADGTPCLGCLPHGWLHFASRRNVLSRGRGAFAKKILLHLLPNDFLVSAPGRIEPVCVQQHLAELHPRVPCLLRDVLVN